MALLEKLNEAGRGRLLRCPMFSVGSPWCGAGIRLSGVPLYYSSPVLILSCGGPPLLGSRAVTLNLQRRMRPWGKSGLPQSIWRTGASEGRLT